MNSLWHCNINKYDLHFQPYTLHLVPPVMVMLAKHTKVSEYDLSSVKRIFCGAAPLSAEIEEAVKRKFNLRFIHQGKHFLAGKTTLGL